MFNVKIDDKEIIKLLNKLSKELKSVKGVQAGWYDEVHKSDDNKSVKMVDVVFTHEFGSKDGKVPARPFIRPALKKQKNWKELVKALISDGFTLEEIAGKVGNRIKEDLQKRISSNTPPPLKASTIKRKGSDKTLIDTAAMFESIHYEVVKKRWK